MSRTNNSSLAALVRKLWKDDCGAVLTGEMLLIFTILVIGLVPGYIALRQGLLTELGDIANAFLGLNQSYSYAGNDTRCGDCDGNRGRTWGDWWGGLWGRSGHGSDGHGTATVDHRGMANDGRGLNGGQGRGGCSTLATTAGSGFKDTCDSVRTRRTDARVCEKTDGACD